MWVCAYKYLRVRSRAGGCTSTGGGEYSTVLVHLVLGLGAGGSLAGIEDHSLLESDDSVVGREHVRWGPCGFPIPASRGAVRPPSTRLPLLPRREEEPLFSVSLAQLPTILCACFIILVS